MKISFKFFSLCLLGLLIFSNPTLAQDPNPVNTEAETTEDLPLDDIVEKRLVDDRMVLPYAPIREADVFWEKRIWRVIDIREKMNLPFAYPEKPFFTILMEAAVNGEIAAYDVNEYDKFEMRLQADEIASMGSNIDTVITFDPETYEEQVQIVRNDLNPEDVKQFRLKEVWFFDENESKLKVRILGIAPLIDVKDDNGNYRFTKPMFWIYYPDCRELFARNKVFNSGNDGDLGTWEDLFERRFFSSYIYKESNVYNRRIQDYLQGVDILLEADKIKQEIFNYEHDLWSY
jgi:gliding motility associated protien GldN